MDERFLHYLWHQGLYLPLQLSTGEKVQVISSGEYNQDAGPDFFNARVKIDGTLWVGNVEIHQKSSDWYTHNHHLDSAYNNVILHLVKYDNSAILTRNNRTVPTAILLYQPELEEQYQFLKDSKGWIPCQSFLPSMDAFILLQWKEALLVERLQQKTSLIEQRFNDLNKNWEETFYHTLAANFGFKVNSLPFERMAKSLHLNYLAKHKDNLFDLESMLFGQAGLIPEFSNDDYQSALAKNYLHFKAKFNLTPVSKDLWKFLRLRPANFPTIRIAQFAALVNQSVALFSKIIETDNIQRLKELFNVTASAYWDGHYTFTDDGHQSMPKHLGTSAFENIAINTIIPILFFYGTTHNDTSFTGKALLWLDAIGAEKNQVIRHWEQYGMECKSAFDSQALIQLHNNYCKSRRCLNCRIGNQVIRHTIKN